MNYTGFKDEYHLGTIHLYNGDCMNLLKQTPDKYYSLALVDPPYGLPSSSTHGRGKLKNRIINNRKIKQWN